MPPPKSHGREQRSDLRQDGNVREVVERALQAGQPLEDIDVVVRARYACAWGSGDALHRELADEVEHHRLAGAYSSGNGPSGEPIGFHTKREFTAMADMTAPVFESVDRHPLAAVAQVFTSIAIMICVVAAGLSSIGALAHNGSALLAGVLALAAGITLELRSQVLARRALADLSTSQR